MNVTGILKDKNRKIDWALNMSKISAESGCTGSQTAPMEGKVVPIAQRNSATPSLGSSSAAGLVSTPHM